MKTLDEYRKELEKDPRMKRKLKKLEEEYESVEKSLTEEELVKYGLKPAAHEGNETSDDSTEKDAANEAASSVIDVLSRKI